MSRESYEVGEGAWLEGMSRVALVILTGLGTRYDLLPSLADPLPDYQLRCVTFKRGTRVRYDALMTDDEYRDTPEYQRWQEENRRGRRR